MREAMAGGADAQRLHGLSGGRCNNRRIKRRNGLKIENLGNLEEKR